MDRDPASSDSLAAALLEAQSAQHELDRKVFLLSSLHEAVREFIGISDPTDMLRSFLLTSMGTMSASKGFALILDPAEPDPMIVHQGVDKDEADRLRQESAGIAKTYISDKGLTQGEARQSNARLVMRQDRRAHSPLPRRTEIVLAWTMGHGCSGLCGLSSRITRQPYSDTDIDYLLNLVDLLAQALSNALGAKTVQGLNKELERKNADLNHALEAMRDSQISLDKRIYHLSVLYDATVELSRLKNPVEIMNAFLLLLLGSFSVENGIIMLPTQGRQFIRIAVRGDYPPDVTQADAEKLLYAAIGAVDFEKLVELSAHPIPNPEEVLGQGKPDLPSLPFAPHAAILFRIDADSLGLMCLGQRLTGDPYSEEDMEVLLTLCGNFLIFMKNAHAFKTIQGLNKDLSARNVELQTTLDELTASRGRIEVLERAGARIRTAIQREVDRLGRASKLDILWVALTALILGVAFNMTNPKGVPLAPEVWTRPRAATINADDAVALYYSQQAVVVDARPAEFFAQSHVAEAVNLPPALFDFIYTMKFAQMDPATPLLVYGRNISRRYDEEVAYRLSSQGHEQVMVIREDLAEMEQRGFPLE